MDLISHPPCFYTVGSEKFCELDDGLCGVISVWICAFKIPFVSQKYKMVKSLGAL